MMMSFRARDLNNGMCFAEEGKLEQMGQLALRDRTAGDLSSPLIKC